MVSFNLLSYNIQDTVMNTTINHPRMINPGTNPTFIRQNTEPGGLEVHTTDAVIEVDTKPCRESMGLGQLSDASLVKYYVDKGYQVADEATRSIVQQGNMVEENRTPPAQIAKSEFMRKNEPVDANIAFYPSVPPEITVNPGTTDITQHPTQVNIDWENTAIVPYQLQRGTVSFDIVQKAYVDITYLGEPMFFPDPEFQSWA
ncbi:MAG: hypothetical protein HDT46_07660 [Ruminococcaceae bacterium]|nr:hypothetical protein [Oscillospiraceae bacterium]MBD5116377.1 hypothetical protein [Oscillospiraceae bacterium]